jgi:CBS domain-containing protein
MAQRIEDIMTQPVVTVDKTATIGEASRKMRDHQIGDVVVVDGDEVRGIVTDRDIVIRAVAEHRLPADTFVEDVASMDVLALSPEDTVAMAIDAVRGSAIRRIPVVRDGKAVGIISLGDLALERDPDSALADVSRARADA